MPNVMLFLNHGTWFHTNDKDQDAKENEHFIQTMASYDFQHLESPVVTFCSIRLYDCFSLPGIIKSGNT